MTTISGIAAHLEIFSGQTVSDVTVLDGARLSVDFGGTATGTTLSGSVPFNGGTLPAQQIVAGTAAGTIIGWGASEVVLPTGVTSGTIIKGGWPVR